MSGKHTGENDMTDVQNAKNAWVNYQNWKAEWVKACNANARLEYCWKLNDLMLKARDRFKAASRNLSNAELMEATREAA